jgi:glutathione S-transferase
MLTLYHRPRSRSSRFLWLLEELGAPYEIKLVTIRAGDGSGALDPNNPHPHGKVPVIVHDGTMVFESAAICAYLTDAFPKNGLGPKIGDKTRGPYLSWLAYYTGVLEPAFVSKFLKVEVPRGTAGWVNVDEAMEFVDKTLGERAYVAGDTFTAADILYATSFVLFASSPIMPKTKNVDAYVKRCIARPAFAKAQAKENG